MMIFQFIGIQIFSLMYLLLVLIIYSSKKRYKAAENDIFKILLIFTMFELILDIVTSYLIRYSYLFPNITPIFCKALMSGYQIWAAILMLYVLLLPKEKKYNSLKELISKSWSFQIGCIIVFILAFTMFLMPTNYIYDSNYNISYIVGFSTIYNYAVSIIYLLIILFSIIINGKKISFSKRLPIFIFIITACIFLPIQRFNSDVPVLIVPLMSYAIMIMYFTLENPDIKLIKELNELKKEAEESVKYKTTILDNISYNMKTPMNTIMSLTQLLTLKDLKPDEIKYVQNINNASKILFEMIDNTIDASKIESGIYKINNIEYKLSSMVKKLYFETLNSISNDNVKLEFNVNENIPSILYGDCDKLYRVLSNILSNSVKYTNVGKIIFSIDGIIIDNKVELIFKISDSGIGIKEENFDKVFSKFSKIDDKKEVKGTGLGLYLSKKMIEMLNGEISFESTYEAGTTFYVKIKQDIKDLACIGKVEYKNNIDNSLNLFDASGYKALIIDNNRQDINVMKMILKEYKLNIKDILILEDNYDSLNIDEKYNLIFINGKSLGEDNLRILRTFLSKDGKIIALTSNLLDNSCNYSISNIYDECLLKPIDLLEIDKILNKYFNK